MSQPLQLLVTDRMRLALKRIPESQLNEEQEKEYKAIKSILKKESAAKLQLRSAAATAASTPLTPQLITIQQLHTLSRLYRTTVPQLTPSPPTTPSDHSVSTDTPAESVSPIASCENDSSELPASFGGWFHQLVIGSRPYCPPRKPNRPPRDPQFLQYLAEQRIKQERREYHQMVKDLPGNKHAFDESYDPARDSVKGASRDIGHGLNILTLMATGFIVFYYAGSNLFPHNPMLAVFCGMGGLVGALMLEVTLFLVREQKSDIEAANHAKIDHSIKLAKQRQEANRRRTGEVEKELARRKALLERLQMDGEIEETKID